MSGSLLANLNRQSTQDLDDDGWIDMPGDDRAAIRPRLFWDRSDGSSAFLTLGAMTEDRQGGTLSGRVAPDGAPFPQDQDTRRLDAGLAYDRPLDDWGVAQLRASGARQDHDHVFGELLEKDRHEAVLTEASLSAEALGASWVGGVAYQVDSYSSEAFPVFDYRYEVPAVFVQLEQSLVSSLTIAGSARWDNHSEFGDLFSPRLSLLFKPGAWSIRTSWGQGFYAPTPFTEETESTGLSRLEPLSGLREETAQTASLDFSYRQEGWKPDSHCSARTLTTRCVSRPSPRTECG